MRLAVLGAGAWGTALAASFAAQHTVTLWGRDTDHTLQLAADQENKRYLPGIPLPGSLHYTSNLTTALADCDAVLVVTPMAALRSTLQAIVQAGCSAPVLWACKGLEVGSMQSGHQIAAALLPANQARGLLTGPSFAREVAQGLPAALTLASADAEFAHRMAETLHSGTLRIYSSRDIIGAEIGGAIKNVIAIAAGISDGLALGNNARAALITRGLVEMSRFGVALGGQAETFTGLSGLGDLILTCTGALSRNRKVGMLLAQGQSLPEILANLGHVAEGVPTAQEVLSQARQSGIEMPITAAVCRVLFEGTPAPQVVAELMARDIKDENRSGS